MLLFQRLISSGQGIGCNVDVETAFSYELCTFPLALSENNGYLGEAYKPQLANAIWKCIEHVLWLHQIVLIMYQMEGNSYIKSNGKKELLIKRFA